MGRVGTVCLGSEGFLVGSKGEIILPNRSSDDSLANTFSDFFTGDAAEKRHTVDDHNSSMSETAVMDTDF